MSVSIRVFCRRAVCFKPDITATREGSESGIADSWFGQRQEIWHPVSVVEINVENVNSEPSLDQCEELKLKRRLRWAQQQLPNSRGLKGSPCCSCLPSSVFDSVLKYTETYTVPAFSVIYQPIIVINVERACRAVDTLEMNWVPLMYSLLRSSKLLSVSFYHALFLLTPPQTSCFELPGKVQPMVCNKAVRLLPSRPVSVCKQKRKQICLKAPSDADCIFHMVHKSCWCQLAGLDLWNNSAQDEPCPLPNAPSRGPTRLHIWILGLGCEQMSPSGDGSPVGWWLSL